MIGVQEYDQEIGNFNNDNYKIQYQNEENLQMPAKQHIITIDNKIKEYNDDSNYASDQKTDFKAQLNDLCVKQTQKIERIQQELQIEADTILKDFRKQIQLCNDETAYLNNQIINLNQDRIKIQQNIIVLETRISEEEQILGYI